MKPIIFIIVEGLIVIIIYYTYHKVFKPYKNMNMLNVKNYYIKNYKKYSKGIKAFNDGNYLFNNIDDLIEQIKESYEKRRKNIIADELELKDIINNFKNNDFTEIPLLSILITITISICISILNSKTFENFSDLRMNALANIFIMIFAGIFILIIIHDFECTKKSREISFYELCLEILLKVKNREFDNKEKSQKNEVNNIISHLDICMTEATRTLNKCYENMENTEKVFDKIKVIKN